MMATSPATCGDVSEQAGGSGEKQDFAKTLSEVVGEDFGTADTTTNTVSSTQKLGSSDNWVTAVEPQGIGNKHSRRESKSVVILGKASTTNTAAKERGHVKKHTENTPTPTAATDAAIPLGQLDTIPTTAPTVDILAEAQTAPAIPQQGRSNIQVESKSSVATSAQDEGPMKNDSAKPLENSGEVAVNEKAPSPSGLVASTSNVAGDANRVGALFHQPSVDPSLSSLPDEMTLIKSVSHVETQQSNDQSLPAIKDVIEMRIQDHFDGLEKWARKTRSSGEPRVVLQMPATTPGVSVAEIEGGPSKGASATAIVEGHVRAPNSDPFEIMDTPCAEPAPQILHSSHHEVEIGIYDPNHGWVEIRTHKYAGEISASLSASSIEAQHNLRGQLSALTEYLTTRDIPINKIVMESGNNANPGGQHSGEPRSGGQGEGSRDERGGVFASAPKHSDELNETLPSHYQGTSQIHLLA